MLGWPALPNEGVKTTTSGDFVLSPFTNYCTGMFGQKFSENLAIVNFHPGLGRAKRDKALEPSGQVICKPPRQNCPELMFASHRNERWSARSGWAQRTGHLGLALACRSVATVATSPRELQPHRGPRKLLDAPNERRNKGAGDGSLFGMAGKRRARVCARACCTTFTSVSPAESGILRCNVLHRKSPILLPFPPKRPAR